VDINTGMNNLQLKNGAFNLKTVLNLFYYVYYKIDQ